jgi:hypothetical protein
MAIGIIIIGMLFPVGWVVADISDCKIARRILGLLTIVVACFFVWGVGMLKSTNYNASYGQASKEMLEALAPRFQAHTAERKILDQAISDFQPTYENRANYDEIVQNLIKELKKVEPVAAPSSEHLAPSK